MIRKEKVISAILSFICTLLILFIYLALLETKNQPDFLYCLLLIPCFILFLTIFTSLIDIFQKRNVKFNICFLFQGITGLVTWLSLTLTFSNVNNSLKDITVVTFGISFFLWLISTLFSMTFEGK